MAWPEVGEVVNLNLQEDIDNRSVALSVKATKITAQVLARAMQAAVEKMKQFAVLSGFSGQVDC